MITTGRGNGNGYRRDDHGGGFGDGQINDSGYDGFIYDGEYGGGHGFGYHGGGYSNGNSYRDGDGHSGTLWPPCVLMADADEESCMMVAAVEVVG